MRYYILTAVAITFLIITSSMVYELDRAPAGMASIYKKEVSFSFLFERESSFYSSYSLTSNFERKLVHFLVYGVIALFLSAIVPVKRRWIAAVMAVMTTSTIGMVDEIHQHFLAGRSGRVLDVLINSLGSFTFVCFQGLLTKKPQKDRSLPEAEKH
ncbi:VanZ family protein [Bacillus sp. H-16]|uniref:VanZ family protein n=1 Tax=Alteribacter salitolerans TaxID=2912333 RepID=UPI0019624FB4|nr:VanZ family protein [Alteribacter salitolerans]MBM7095792.1 VanZ family protein [Alteribacter salitolerans]